MHENATSNRCRSVTGKRTTHLKAPLKKAAAPKNGAAKAKPAAKKTTAAAKSGVKASPGRAAAKTAKPKTAKPKTAKPKTAKPAATGKPFRKAPARKPAAAATSAAALPEIPADLLEAAPRAQKPRKPRGRKTESPKQPGVLDLVLAQLDDAKAEQIVTISLDDKTAIADNMVVASGRSNRHVGAIADQLVEKLKTAGHRDLRVEGMPQCDWVLVDAGDVVVHIFRPEVRSFYNLEKLWSMHAPGDRLAM